MTTSKNFGYIYIITGFTTSYALIRSPVSPVITIDSPGREPLAFPVTTIDLSGFGYLDIFGYTNLRPPDSPVTTVSLSGYNGFDTISYIIIYVVGYTFGYTDVISTIGYNGIDTSGYIVMYVIGYMSQSPPVFQVTTIASPEGKAPASPVITVGPIGFKAMNVIGYTFIEPSAT